jgi:hypothetical protein
MQKYELNSISYEENHEVYRLLVLYNVPVFGFQYLRRIRECLMFSALSFGRKRFVLGNGAVRISDMLPTTLIEVSCKSL